MTKQDLQKELLAKVKPGTKPSHLKRSRSADDLVPPAPPLPTNPELEKLKRENTQLKQEAQTIQKQLKELADLAKSSPTPSAKPTLTDELKKQTDLNTLLTEQLKEKQQEIEELRAEKQSFSEAKELQSRFNALGNPEPTELSELDHSLFARRQSLKDWFSQYSKNKKLDQELEENVNEFVQEVENQDKKISQLRLKAAQLNREKESLQKDLSLAQRLAEIRKAPYHSTDPYQSLKYSLYSLAAVVFTLWLTSRWTKPTNSSD